MYEASGSAELLTFEDFRIEFPQIWRQRAQFGEPILNGWRAQAVAARTPLGTLGGLLFRCGLRIQRREVDGDGSVTNTWVLTPRNCRHQTLSTLKNGVTDIHLREFPRRATTNRRFSYGASPRTI